MIERALYMETIAFLSKNYGSVSDWECRRVLMCLDAGLVFLERDPDGTICTYVGWWLIPRKDVERMANMELSVEEAINLDVTAGNTVWVMDGASTRPGGIPACRKYLRERYPVSSGIGGIAWLRYNKDKRLISQRQKGI